MKWFKAKGVRKPVILSLLAVVLLVGGVGIGFALKTQPVAPVKSTVQAQPPTRAELLKLVNEQRAKVGIAPLVESPLLDKSAQWKADDEVNYSYYGHISPVNSPFAGMQGYKLIDRTGQRCVYESENLTKGTASDPNTALDDVRAWINSPPHFKAMVDPQYDITGFGINGPYVVEHFCNEP